MTLLPIGTKMLISDGTTYEILEYDDNGSVIVRYKNNDYLSWWTVDCIRFDTVLTPLVAALL